MRLFCFFSWSKKGWAKWSVRTQLLRIWKTVPLCLEDDIIFGHSSHFYGQFNFCILTYRTYQSMYVNLGYYWDCNGNPIQRQSAEDTCSQRTVWQCKKSTLSKVWSKMWGLFDTNCALPGQWPTSGRSSGGSNKKLVRSDSFWQPSVHSHRNISFGLILAEDKSFWSARYCDCHSFTSVQSGRNPHTLPTSLSWYN